MKLTAFSTILLPSYITTIYRATTLTGAAHSHKQKRTQTFIEARPPRCYMKIQGIDSSDGAVRPSGLSCRSSASHAAPRSAQTQCPSSVRCVGKPSARSGSLLVPAATSHLFRRQPRPIHRTITAKTVRNGRRSLNEPGLSSPTFRPSGKPSARLSIVVNTQWPSHSGV